jgi:protein-S-isoprenylcysteine O-methyltransferase Ste14
VAFVASLGYFVYAYTIRFGRATVLPVTFRNVAPPVLIDLALFTLFAVHHSIMARSGAKQWIARYVPPAFERSLYVWIGSVLFVLICLWWQDVPGILYALESSWRFAGWAVQGAGVWLALDAARAIDFLDLAGIRQVIGRTRTDTLQSRGAYRFVRHPIYLGWVLLTFGAPVMTATRFSFACISTLYLVLAIPFEERGLVQTFGEDYVTYQRRVRWRMIPGLY